MDTATLDRQLLTNLADMDAATNRLWSIEQRLSDEMNALRLEWCRENGWVFDEEYFQVDADFHLGLPEWRLEKEDWNCWFELAEEYGKPGYGEIDQNSFWITKICKVGSGCFGLRFMQEKFDKVEWKAYIKEKGEMIAGTRFRIDDAPSVFVPFVLNASDIVAALERDDFEECLQPLRDTFDHLRQHVGLFESLMEGCRKSRRRKSSKNNK